MKGILFKMPFPFIITLELATSKKIYYYAKVSFKLTNNNMPTKTTIGGR